MAPERSKEYECHLPPDGKVLLCPQKKKLRKKKLRLRRDWSLTGQPLWPNYNVSPTYIDFPEIRGFPWVAPPPSNSGNEGL